MESEANMLQVVPAVKDTPEKGPAQRCPGAPLLLWGQDLVARNHYPRLSPFGDAA